MSGEQLVIVSDIHLGEDLAQHGPATLQEYISRLNEQFVTFLEWLSVARGDAPVVLVINGDMFDFVKISLRPDPREAYMRWQQGMTKREHALGLDNSPAHVVWKLERIMENHRPLFWRLAQFLGDGNRLQIVAGNHDREFYYPEIMEALTTSLADIYFSQHPADASTRAAFEARVQFSMWFHYSPAGVYIEHGHQYDPYCSFEYLLAPLKREGDLHVALPLTHRAIPYFANLKGEVSTHNLDTRGIGYYLRELTRLGPRFLFSALWAYARAVVAILREAGPKGQRARRSLAAQHEAQRREVAAKYDLSEEVVRALDGLHATPAEFSLWTMVQAFYVDRFALFFATLGGLSAEAWLVDDRVARLAAMGATALGWFIVSEFLARSRRFDTRQALRDGAAGVARVLHPKLIVFGHSHKPETKKTSSGAYLNIGSWISRAALLGESEWGMTFAWVNPKGKPSGLYRWVGTQRDAALVEAV